MPIAEPTGPLWTAVKAIHDPWPLDLEESAATLAAAWRQGGTAMGTGATDSTTAGTAANAAWSDNPGDGFAATVSTEAQTIANLKAQMEVVAGRGDAYSSELGAAKTDIATNIAANSGLYAMLGNPLFGMVGPMMQKQLASWVAGNLRTMIEGRAESLRNGTAGEVPQPEPLPPPPAPAPPEDDGNFWSDLGHTALDIVGLVPVVGELADVANAGWYAYEGDYLNAGLSLAAAIPFAGWAATGGKIGYKAFNDLVRIEPVNSASGAWAFVKNRPPGVPMGAQQLPFTPTRRFLVGEKYTWADPRFGQVTHHGHGLDTKRFQVASQRGEDVGNAARGPVVRQQVVDGYFKGYGDQTGRVHDIDTVRSNDAIANATHIPANRNYPAPDEVYTRVAVPNPAALGSNDSGESQ